MSSSQVVAGDEADPHVRLVWHRRLHLSKVLLTLLLAFSVVLNVLLARKVRQLTAGQNSRVAELPLKVGTVVPGFQAVDLEGQTQFVAYDERGGKLTVLYVFTPPCHWCERNVDNLKELVARKGDGYRFIGISLAQDGLSDYVSRNGLPVYTNLSGETKKAYKLGGTPQTIVVSAEGQVLKDWVGAYTGIQQKQVEQYFGVSLPGLRPEDK